MSEKLTATMYTTTRRGPIVKPVLVTFADGKTATFPSKNAFERWRKWNKGAGAKIRKAVKV